MVQGAKLMSKFGVNVPKGVVVSSAEEVPKVLNDVFPDNEEVIYSSLCKPGSLAMLAMFKGTVLIGLADFLELGLFVQ